MSALSAVYGGVARLRRSWYEHRPQSRLRLPRPVVSVGNLVVGGSGKTPVVAAVAATLMRLGHRPAILSRGYGRKSAQDVIVVTDGRQPLVPVDESGDESQMLARELSGVPIVVAADRYRGGRTAIERFDSTVMILDDGFQHLKLERTVDLVVVSHADLGEKVLPAGRLREPLGAARVANAVLVYGDAAEAGRVAAAVGVSQSFAVHARYLPMRALRRSSLTVRPPSRTVAVAGIAQPDRFFDALRQQGYDVVRAIAFRDHHWFSASDVDAIQRTARELQADFIATTAKDAVRLEPMVGDTALPWAILPLEVSIEPVAEFESWLRQRL